MGTNVVNTAGGAGANAPVSTNTVTLASGASGTSTAVDVRGAKAVAIGISCDVNHQLTVGNVVMTMIDGKSITFTPGAGPNGLDAGANIPVTGIGLITGLDLAASTPRIISLIGGGAAANISTRGPIMYGVASVALALTKAASPGNAVYTIFTQVIY